MIIGGSGVPLHRGLRRIRFKVSPDRVMQTRLAGSWSWCEVIMSAGRWSVFSVRLAGSDKCGVSEDYITLKVIWLWHV
jgi:hypothetical protein